MKNKLIIFAIVIMAMTISQGFIFARMKKANTLTDNQKYIEIDRKVERDKFISNAGEVLKSIYSKIDSKYNKVDVDIAYVKSKHAVVAFDGKHVIALIKVPKLLRSNHLN